MKSEKIEILAKALNKVQKNILTALKGTENTFYKSKYADLTAVWEVARKPLTDNGFSVTQPTRIDPNNGTFFLDTILLHESGQWIKGQYLIKPDKETPQGYGSAMTYARRYSFAAIVGVVTEDDDGEGAMNRKKTPTKKDEKIKKEMELDLMSPQDRAQIVKRGREYDQSLSKKDIGDAIKWYGGINKLDPNSGEMATRCIDKPGIEKIITDWLDYNLGEGKK